MSIPSQKNGSITNSSATRSITSWLVGSVGAYLLTSFFSNFYPLPLQFALLVIVFQLLCGIGAFLLSWEFSRVFRTENGYDWLTILILVIALILAVFTIIISFQFPGLFDGRILFMDSSMLPFFILLSVLSLAPLIVILNAILRHGYSERWQNTRFHQFVQENFPGILLATFFLLIYFVFAESINFPGFRTVDQYFDTDISEWIQRLTATPRQDVMMLRAVHPAILVFLRPVVWLLSIPLNGNRLHAAFLLNALTGALCVLIVWLIVKRASGSTAYALIIAMLLGISTSHLLLSSILETYIYSALALLLFVWLIQNEKPSLKFTVAAGILVFGITITNIIQTCILYFFKRPSIKVIVRYLLMTVLIVAALNLFQVWFYPNAKLLVQPSNLVHEKQYVANPLNLSWRTEGRLYLTVRAVSLYGVVAPTPFVLTEELGMDVPNFRTFQILSGQFHVASYRGLADITVKVWMLILVTAGILFVLNLFNSPKQTLLPLSLLLCIGFSLVLQFVYGDDPLLYSPDWVYALVLFVAFMLQRWANQKWLQLSMIAFLMMLMTTNLGLIHQIMQVSAPFYSK